MKNDYRQCALQALYIIHGMQVTQSIFSAYGDSVLDVQTWFARFRSRNFDLNDKERSC